MIGEGDFRTRIMEAWDILKKMALDSFHNFYPARGSEIVDQLRGTSSYRELFDTYTRHSAYDFLLDDGSLLFFVRDVEAKTPLSFGYLPCAYDAPTHRASNEAYGRLDESDYLALFQESEASDGGLYVRYDFSPALYKCSREPSSHFHFGFHSDSRVGCASVLDPLGFVLFVARQFYPEQYQSWLHALPAHEIDALAKRMRRERDDTALHCVADLVELRLS